MESVPEQRSPCKDGALLETVFEKQHRPVALNGARSLGQSQPHVVTRDKTSWQWPHEQRCIRLEPLALLGGGTRGSLTRAALTHPRTNVLLLGQGSPALRGCILHS